MKNRTYVGLDVHAKSISIAVILPDGELLEEKIPNRRQAVARWVTHEYQVDSSSVDASAGTLSYSQSHSLDLTSGFG